MPHGADSHDDGAHQREYAKRRNDCGIYMREKENQQGSPCNVQLNLKVMGHIFNKMTPYGGRKNLLHFKSFFEWHQKRHKYDARDVQVNVELDGELHEVEQA